MKTLLALSALLLLPLAPQGGAPADLQEFKCTDGQSHVGTVVSLDQGKVKLRVSILGGSMVITRKLDEFEPASAFRIQLAANPPKDFDEHFAMAKKAAELGLRTAAGAQARLAVAKVKGTPDYEAKHKLVRAWAADALEKMVRDAVAAGDLPTAKASIELLTTRFGDQRTEEQLDAIATLVEGLGDKKKADEAAKRQARLDAKQREMIERNLKPIEKNVAQGTKLYNDAVRKTQTGASSKLCEQAIAEFRKAYNALKDLVEKNPDDEHLAAAAATLGKEMHDTAIRAALHAANMLCVQTDYKGALEWTQKVIAFDPDNAEAKEMMKAIQAAQADGDDWRWGWTIGDIGRVGQGPRPTPHNR